MRLFEWIRAGTKDEITASRFQIEFVATGVVVRFREPLNEASVKALVSISDESSTKAAT